MSVLLVFSPGWFVFAKEWSLAVYTSFAAGILVLEVRMELRFPLLYRFALNPFFSMTTSLCFHSCFPYPQPDTGGPPGLLLTSLVSPKCNIPFSFEVRGGNLGVHIFLKQLQRTTTTPFYHQLQPHHSSPSFLEPGTSNYEANLSFCFFLLLKALSFVHLSSWSVPLPFT